MKRNENHIIPHLLCSFFIFLFLYSCSEPKKTHFLEERQNFQDKKLEEYLYESITILRVPIVKVVYDGIVEFESETYYQNTYNQLYERDFVWNDRFTHYFKDVSFEELDSIVGAIGFRSQQTLDDFEKLNGFRSLRTQINEDIDHCYQYGDASDPEVHLVVDDVARALLNQNGEIMIGGVIYHYKKDGAIVRVRSFEDLEQVRNLSSSECKKAGFEGDYYDIKKCEDRFSFRCGSLDCGKSRMKWYASFYNVGTQKAVVGVKTVSERMDEQGKWQRSYSKIGVQIDGMVRDAIKQNRPIPIAYKSKKYLRKNVSNQVTFSQNRLIYQGELSGCFKFNKHKNIYRYIR